MSKERDKEIVSTVKDIWRKHMDALAGEIGKTLDPQNMPEKDTLLVSATLSRFADIEADVLSSIYAENLLAVTLR